MFKDVALYAAFFMEGLRDSGDYGELLDKWDKGCLELVDFMCDYAPQLHRLVEAASEARDAMGRPDRPSILEYEVASAFGVYIGHAVIATGEMPEPEECTAWLKSAVIGFFTQDLDLDESVRFAVDTVTPLNH